MAYKIPRWRPEEISFRLLAEHTDHPIITIGIDVPDAAIRVMSVPEVVGRRITLRGVHVESDGLGPNRFGVANLMMLAQLAMEMMDCDELRIEGAVRTTGANFGAAQGPIRFTRRPVVGMGRPDL